MDITIEENKHTPGGYNILPDNHDSGIETMHHRSDLSQSIKEFNDDSIDPHTRMSGIDMRARLHSLEINSILAMDTLVSLKLLPVSCSAFTRQKKRLSVSLAGEGRKEIVEMVKGERTKEDTGSAFKKFFGMGDRQ